MLFQNQLKNGRFWLASLLVALLSFPLYSILPTAAMQQNYFVGTDFSYAWLVNHLWQEDFSLLQHTHFPHGELGLLQYLWPLSGFFYAGWFIVFLQRLLLATICLYFLQKHLKWWWAMPLTWLVIVPLTFSQGMELQALILALLTLQKKRPQLWLALLALTAAFSFYIRLFPFMLSTSLLCGSALLLCLQKAKNYRMLIWPFVSLTVIVLAWLMLFGNVQSLLAKWPFTLELLKGSPFGTALYPTNNNLLLFIAFAGLVFIWWRSASTFELILFGGAAFLIFKYAFVREGYAHLLVFIKLIFPLSLFVLLRANSGRKFTLPALLLAFVAFSWNMQQVTGQFGMRLPNLQSLARVESYFNVEQAQDLFNAETAYLQESRNWPEAKALAGGATASVFPYDYLYPIVNENEVLPTPVAQSYVAYTPWLDSVQASFFSGPDAPEFLYLHQGWGANPNVQISNQYYPHVAPITQRAIHNNYKLVLQQDRVALYQRDHSITKSLPKFWQPEILPVNRWQPVPPSAEALYLKARLGLTALGQLRNMLYKPPRVQISFRLEDESVETFDLNLLNLESGLLVQPFYRIPTKSQSQQVKAIMISCPQPGFLESARNF